jgi:hypothetical protein
MFKPSLGVHMFHHPHSISLSYRPHTDLLKATKPRIVLVRNCTGVKVERPGTEEAVHLNTEGLTVMEFVPREIVVRICTEEAVNRTRDWSLRFRTRSDCEGVIRSSNNIAHIADQHSICLLV